MVQDEPIGALSVYTDQYHLFSRDQIRIFKGIANEAAAVIEKAMLYEERLENQRTEQELATAAKIQENLMPQENPNLPGYTVAAKNIPSRTVGGDLYDFISFGESHFGIAIADVSGKGIPGAILMASARATFRAYLEDPHSVKGAITKLNRVLCRDTQAEQFVSFFYGMLDIEDGTFTYVNAGHNPPVLFRDDEELFLREGGPILGVLQDASYEENSLQIMPGDVILLYTDGITEAERDDEYFGVEKLLDIVRTNISKNSDEIVDEVLRQVATFSEGSPQSDDRTIIVIRKQ